MAHFLSLGAPLMDYIVWVSEEFLKGVHGEKGGMEPITHLEFVDLLHKVGSVPVIAAGGSQANTLKALARMGDEGRFIGVVGDDSKGERYLELMENTGVECFLYHGTEYATGGVLCMITPDGERTMRTWNTINGCTCWFPICYCR